VAAVNGQMSDADLIETATRRLWLALDALEAAAERRSEADHGEESLADQIHALGSDRAKLASELDEVTARVRVLETANREVMQRIDQAIETIRDVLASNGSPDDKPEVGANGTAAVTDDPTEDDPADEDSDDDDAEDDDADDEDSDEDDPEDDAEDDE
jgi:chromosome segregation ATPase